MQQAGEEQGAKNSAKGLFLLIAEPISPTVPKLMFCFLKKSVQNLVDFFMSWLRISMLQKLLFKQVHDEKLRCSLLYSSRRKCNLLLSGDDRPPSLSPSSPLHNYSRSPEGHQPASGRTRQEDKKEENSHLERGGERVICLLLSPGLSNTVQHFRFLAASGADGEWG